ncbi:hypothetical protein EVAR_45823_1 [Eumeta japonica]|uniref:Uncharacterized protein n=1 Tax=Eumeta variegata TaxID=151549 RepID=A0A4C1WPG6_EUMVA|nr:hypothetical protein EVAR_45823_1 [Eumeta japonica]
MARPEFEGCYSMSGVRISPTRSPRIFLGQTEGRNLKRPTLAQRTLRVDDGGINSLFVAARVLQQNLIRAPTSRRCAHTPLRSTNLDPQNVIVTSATRVISSPRPSLGRRGEPKVRCGRPRLFLRLQRKPIKLSYPGCNRMAGGGVGPAARKGEHRAALSRQINLAIYS